MLSKIYAGATVGLDAVPVEVEVDVANKGLPSFTIVGLPNKSIDEAKDRVRTAIVNTSFDMPDSRITVNLAPADIPKEGSGYDLPIALGILTSLGVIDVESCRNSVFAGELSLEGNVRPITGAISVAQMARDKRFKSVFLPADNAEEASLIEGITIYPVKSLIELVWHLNGDARIRPLHRASRNTTEYAEIECDFSEVRGQFQAKRALEIAAAGFHNIHLKGSPGAGKTMLSKAFVSIIPPMTSDEILEVTKVYSIAGLTHKRTIIASRPFRSPHHTTSRIGLIGGGSTPVPGEISLAHRGVLFLDEFAEFPRTVIESLRQPIEDGVVTISRAAGSLTFPARFILIAASNPCPCGYLGHPKRICKCIPAAIIRYKKRLSGPILDRIDLHIDVPPVNERELTGNGPLAESSASIRARIMAARIKQSTRFAGSPVLSNGEMRPIDVKTFCPLTPDGMTLLKTAISRLALSARSYFKVIKVARTIADLENADNIESTHIAEALQYRAKEE